MDEAFSDSQETHDLLAKARTGKPGAFDRLFARHRDYLRRMIEMRMDKRAGRRFDASDIVQETHLLAAERLADYLERRPMPFRLWLRRTAYERLLKMRERHVLAQKRSVRREVPISQHSSLDLARRLVSVEASPSEQFDRREMASRVRRAIARLADADQEIVLMLDVEGLSSDEVGHVLQLDGSTVRRRHARILMRLHDLLVNDGLTESQL